MVYGVLFLCPLQCYNFLVHLLFFPLSFIFVPCRPGDMRIQLSSCYSLHCIYLSYTCLCSPTQRYPGFEYKYIKGSILNANNTFKFNVKKYFCVGNLIQHSSIKSIHYERKYLNKLMHNYMFN